MRSTRAAGRYIPLAWTWRAWGMLAVALALVSASQRASAQSSAGKRVIRLEAIKVEGRIQKPQAFYILQRSNLNFEGLELRQSFVPKIVESVNQAPF